MVQHFVSIALPFLLMLSHVFFKLLTMKMCALYYSSTALDTL